jgi:maleylacetate reductase
MISGHHRYPRMERVVYGRAAAEAAFEAVAGRVALVVTTRSLEQTLAAEVAAAIGAEVYAGVSAHSPREGVIGGAMRAREVGAEVLVAVGGGSVIDAVKVMRMALEAGLTRVDQLDPYRAGRSGDRALIEGLTLTTPMIAVPTTLSAAEFTPFAGVSDAARKVKEGYGHPDLAPSVVILDPAATLATPRALWLSTGMKAVDHAVEQLCNPERAPFADALAEEGLKRLARSLPLSAGGDLEARLDCQFGMWLAISGASTGRGMGASHAIGHTLGGSYGVPHGITSCVTLAAVLKWNEGVDDDRQRLVASLMGSSGTASEAVAGLVTRLRLPGSLSAVGIGPDAFQAIAEHTMHDRGVRTNPRPITGAADVVEILELAR